MASRSRRDNWLVSVLLALGFEDDEEDVDGDPGAAATGGGAAA